MLEHALWYASRGMAVFPLHTATDGRCSCGRDCGSPAKHPRTMNGVKDATTDEEQVRRWWRSWPDSNIGLATGPASGIVVLDVDNDKEKGVWGSDTLRDWEEEQGALPDTWRSLTGGGGVHYIFRLAGQCPRNRTGMLEGLDCRGDGGYIVAPPSLHISGRRYTWDADGDPADVGLAPPPDALLRLMLGRADGGQAFHLPTAIPDGIRNDTLFRLACSLRAKGLSESAIFAAVMEENLQKCSPPKEEREVRTICSSASRYEPGDYIAGAEAEAKAAAEVGQAAQDGGFDDITSLETFQAVYAIKDTFQRQRQIDRLRERAIALKRKTDFDRTYAAFRRQHVASRNSAVAKPVQITDCPVEGLRCARWNVTDHGVKRLCIDNKGDEREEVAASQAIVISERLKNIDTDQEKVKLEFLDKKTGRWQSMIVPKTTVANRQKIVELSGAGLDVTSESAKFLVQYLNDLENASTDVIPSYRSIGRLGWLPDGTFSPYLEDVRFDGQATYKDLFESTRPMGDPRQWVGTALALRGESFTARLALATSFAGPLVGPLGKLPFITHLWGGTDVGKTVGSMFAMSVWGDPSLGKLVRSLNGTLVGLERLAAFLHSVPLCLDELQTIKQKHPNANYDKLIYMLCEGQGRIRGTRDGGIEQMGYWRLSVLTSGEEPITAHNSGGGARNRVLEFYCTQKTFKDLPAAASFAQGNHGHAGPMFLAALGKECSWEEIRGRFDCWFRYFAETKGKMEKQAMGAAILCTADYLSSRYIFGQQVPDTDAFAEELAEQMARNEEIDVAERAWETLCGWITANQARFDYGAPDKGECYGKRMGENEYHIIATVFNDVLQAAGFSPRRCLPAFADRGYIECWLEEKSPGDMVKRYSKKSRIGSASPRCVIVTGLETDEEELLPAVFG